MADDRRAVPVDRLAAGIRLALTNARRFLDGAERVVDESGHIATFLLYHAVEELGKAKLLAEALRRKEPVPIGRKDAFRDRGRLP